MSMSLILLKKSRNLKQEKIRKRKQNSKFLVKTQENQEMVFLLKFASKAQANVKYELTRYANNPVVLGILKVN